MASHWKDWLHEIRSAKPARNTYAETMENLSQLDKIAVWITDHVGTMGFFIGIFVWTVLWLGWNLLAPPQLQFDPPMGFVFWLFISNLIQILLMPLIMVGQNIQGKHAEARAEHDLEINIKAEQEIEVILHHIEEQNDMLIAMLETMGVNSAEALSKIKERRIASSPPPGTVQQNRTARGTAEAPAIDRGVGGPGYQVSSERRKGSFVQSMVMVLVIVLASVAIGSAVLYVSGHPNLRLPWSDIKIR